jgi:hypothetical protein
MDPKEVLLYGVGLGRGIKNPPLNILRHEYQFYTASRRDPSLFPIQRPFKYVYTSQPLDLYLKIHFNVILRFLKSSRFTLFLFCGQHEIICSRRSVL